MRLARTIALTTGATAALLGSTLVPASAETGKPPASPLPLGCAWSAEVSPTASNVYYPDTGATYWATPYVIDSDTTVEVSGTFPDARYMSLVTYQPEGGYFTSDKGVESYLADHQLKADKGSVNPYTAKGQGAGPGQEFTVELATDAKKHDRGNTLPMAVDDSAEGEVGYLVMRVYEPAGGNADRVELPTVTVHGDQGSKELKQCPTTVPITDVETDPNEANVGDPFARQPIGGLFANPHASYVTMDYQVPTGDDVLVVQGTAPVQSGGQEPVAWPDAGADVRYWSMCNNVFSEPYEVVYNEQPDGSTAYGCATDDQTEIAEDGTYTYVVGTEDKREAVEAMEGVTFIPTSAEHAEETHKLILRNLVPSEDFEQSISNVPEDSAPADAEAVMGDYYPEVTETTLTELQQQGTSGLR